MRAISKNTRKATAITLAAALVIAVYLNWQYARTGVTLEEDAVNVSAVSQETVPVTDELMTEAEAVSSANKNYGEAQLVSVANNSGSKFFEEARLKRTKAHDEAMDSIQKALKSASLSTEEKKEYTSQLTGNLADLNAENEIGSTLALENFILGFRLGMRLILEALDEDDGSLVELLRRDEWRGKQSSYPSGRPRKSCDANQR